MSESDGKDRSLHFNSDGSFFETFQRLAQSKSELGLEDKDSTENASTTGATLGEEHSCGAFIESSSFLGRRPGYIFTNGVTGLGYYKDQGLEGYVKRKQDAAKAKPVSIKANKSIVKLPNRGQSSEPTAKRAKTDSADEKPKYLREMEKFKSQSCSGDTKHDRPLVK
ncbi:hypothetical protein CEUSTIGMA_g11209.t1 [Chlamydomonas eustigma]|uniref:Uncharacterized protein n=1 Tax=Chlamydomonas eustigma TaxID=1157962 RepID=A0A250XL35_9CHLO|nr:hypothetical protein CEUSTIGMA_g11209.t1 [Chlamydomonas eustigma]|eukprot:GAX83784.1 hypothetical protein CEUSTIGMA_g11209.t1 [Chlamydomonas eustigma]